jgi:hypothetical protein
LSVVALYVWTAPDALSESNLRDYMEAQRFIAIGGLGQIVVYNCAIAAIILLRRPIHAAFTAIAAALLTLMLAALIAQIPPLSRTGWDSEVLLALPFASFSLATFLVAWLAMKNDWGWKR